MVRVVVVICKKVLPCKKAISENDTKHFGEVSMPPAVSSPHVCERNEAVTVAVVNVNGRVELPEDDKLFTKNLSKTESKSTHL